MGIGSLIGGAGGLGSNLFGGGNDDNGGPGGSGAFASTDKSNTTSSRNSLADVLGINVGQNTGQSIGNVFGQNIGKQTTNPLLARFFKLYLKEALGQAQDLYGRQLKLNPFERSGQQALLGQIPNIQGTIQSLGEGLRGGGGINKVLRKYSKKLNRFSRADPNDPSNVAFRESIIDPVRKEFLETVLPSLGSSAAAVGQLGGSRGDLAELGAGQNYLETVGNLSNRVNQDVKNRAFQAVQQYPILAQLKDIRNQRRDNTLQNILGLQQQIPDIYSAIGAQKRRRPNQALDALLGRLQGVMPGFLGSETGISGQDLQRQQNMSVNEILSMLSNLSADQIRNLSNTNSSSSGFGPPPFPPQSSNIFGDILGGASIGGGLQSLFGGGGGGSFFTGPGGFISSLGF